MIKDGYDVILDEKREIFDNIENYMTSAAHELLLLVPLLENISVEYVISIGNLSMYLSIYLIINLPIYQSVYLSICLSINMSFINYLCMKQPND
jgi:hypothetical protein